MMPYTEHLSQSELALYLARSATEEQSERVERHLSALPGMRPALESALRRYE